MPNYPSKELIQGLLPWLDEQRNTNSPPLIEIQALKERFNLSDQEYGNLFRWMFDIKLWVPIGDKLHLLELLDQLQKRYGTLSDNHFDYPFLKRFSNELDAAQLALQTTILINSVKQALELESDIPKSARDAFSDYLEETFEEKWDSLETLKDLPCPTELLDYLDYWYIIEQIATRLLGL